MAFQTAWWDPLGLHLVKNVGRKWRGMGVMDYHHRKSPSSLWSHMLIPHSILPNHTEGHQLNGHDALIRKAGLRLGKDSTGVEASPNQDKLRRINKYCRLQGLNRCLLAWELGTLRLLRPSRLRLHRQCNSLLSCFIFFSFWYRNNQYLVCILTIKWGKYFGAISPCVLLIFMCLFCFAKLT